MKLNSKRISLLFVILVPTAVYAIIGQLVQLRILSIVENCQCYPGMTAWGYALELLFLFLILNIFLLPLYFSGMLSRTGTVLFVVAELVSYGWAFMLFASNLSTPSPTPDLLVLISIVPVAVLFAFGYTLRILFPRNKASYPSPLTL